METEAEKLVPSRIEYVLSLWDENIGSKYVSSSRSDAIRELCHNANCILYIKHTQFSTPKTHERTVQQCPVWFSRKKKEFLRACRFVWNQIESMQRLGRERERTYGAMEDVDSMADGGRGWRVEGLARKSQGFEGPVCKSNKFIEAR